MDAPYITSMNPHFTPIESQTPATDWHRRSGQAYKNRPDLKEALKDLPYENHRQDLILDIVVTHHSFSLRGSLLWNCQVRKRGDKVNVP